jgi:hypothetical protein
MSKPAAQLIIMYICTKKIWTQGESNSRLFGASKVYFHYTMSPFYMTE